MPIPFAGNLEAIDVVVQPFFSQGAVRVPLHPGLTVLYGRNSVGKTTLLKSIYAALSGQHMNYFCAVRCRIRSSDSLAEVGSDLLDGLFEHLLRLTYARSEGISADGLELEDVPEPQDFHENLGDLRAEVQDRFTMDALQRFGAARSSQIVGLLPGLLHELVDDLGWSGPLEISFVPCGDEENSRWDAFVSTVVEPATRDAWFSLLSGRTKAVDSNSAWEQRWQEGNALLRDDQTYMYSRSPMETWTPLIVHVGRVFDRPASHLASNLTSVDLVRGFYRRLSGRAKGGLLASNLDGVIGLSDSALELGEEVERQANSILDGLFSNPPHLRFDANPPALWINDGFGHWMATEDGGRSVGIDDQGSAMSRWSRLAVELAVSEVDSKVVLVDEPENALHPYAQIRLAQGLAENMPAIAAATIVATHSPALLGVRDAHLTHVLRSPVLGIRCEEVLELGEVDRIVEQLGVTRADVLAMTRTFVLVEGKHDEIVFRAVLREQLDRRRARIIPIHGAKGLREKLEVELLARYSTANLVVVVDGFTRRARERWQMAKSATTDEEARRALRELRKAGGGEADWVGQAALNVLDAGQLGRLEVVGLRHRDIIEYLPLTEFNLPEGQSWRGLRDAHERAKREGTGPKDFKRWLSEEFEATINLRTFANAAQVSKMRDLKDLQQVAEFI